MYENTLTANLSAIIKHPAHATAKILGSTEYPDIYGKARFYRTSIGVLVCTELIGLPSPSDNCSEPVFGLHIHGGGSCSGNESDPFANALTHYDTHNCPHPHHQGDLAPLFGNNKGYAFSALVTNRFTVDEIIGKTVIVHSMPDDFVSQPAGNSGKKIACGVIEPTN